jgi:lipopolysaccharide biosynthesis glycosyltransferase
VRNAVVLVTDDKIFPPAMFAAHRLAKLNPRNDTDILVFSNAHREMAAAEAMNLPFRLAPMNFPPGISLHPTFFRLFVPNVLRGLYRRILYLDVDTYVENAAPFALFDLDMGGHMVAAVRDCYVAFLPNEHELNMTLGGRHRRYFNAGVLLIDGEMYVATDALARLAPIIARMLAPNTYMDQSSLNMLLDGNWLELSPAFNMFLPVWNGGLPRAFPPAITHFAGKHKPWHGASFASAHPSRREIERFLGASPWKSFLTRSAPPRDSRSAGPGIPIPIRLPPSMRSDPAYHYYLRHTVFADVAAGITAANLSPFEL